MPAELRPCPPRGDAVLASVAYREGGTLLLGHLDTVWPAGTLAEMPWRLEAGRASGPGVFDMKAGIAVGMAVLGAMVRESRALPVSLLLVPDEEVGSAASRELTVSVARRHRRVLVLEPSLDGAAKVARKGCGVFQVRFRGRAAHAGLEPEKGASALVELSRFVAFLDGLAAPELGHHAHRDGGARRQRVERGARGGRARGRRAGVEPRRGRARERGARRLPAERRGRLAQPWKAASTGRRSSRRRRPTRSTPWRGGWRKAWAWSSAPRASGAPPTATSSRPRGSRRSTAWARAAAERTPATSTCSSRTCRCAPRSLAALVSEP